LIRWCAVCLLLLALVALVGCGGDLPKGTVAVVGTVSITEKQFDSLKAMYEAAGRVPNKDSQEADYARFEQSIAHYLVTLEVLKHESAAFDVTVTDQDIQSEIAKIKDMFDGDEERFSAALDKQKLTLEQLTQSLKDNLLLDRMKAAVTGDTSVSEEEAKAYYAAHKADFVKQEERETSHILISPVQSSGDAAASPTEEEWEAARAEAEKVRGEIQNGAEFSAEAKKYSDDATSKDAGGELGQITRGQMVPAFEEAVFGLKKGELSDPVKTQYGYHLILVTDIVPEEQLSYDEASESIKSAILLRKQTEAWETWLAEKEQGLGVEYRSGLEPEVSTSSTVESSDSSESTETTEATDSTEPTDSDSSSNEETTSTSQAE
jgi:foldase protein PrsA